MTGPGPVNGGWWPLNIREPYTGAWQRNDPLSVDCLLAYDAVFACVTLIAGDTAKLSFKLKALNEEGIWEDTTSPAFSPVLRKPNHFQNHIQFKEWWINSKLTHGNTYALKQRDNRGVVTAFYILDPESVVPLITEDGGVYYQLQSSSLNKLREPITVPASEIVHDRMNCLFHPLVGISPIFACALAATQGLSIQKDSEAFFNNGARPSGILTAPGAISDDTAKRLKDHWESNYTGKNAGRVAVLGDDLKFVQMKSNAVDSQLIEQLGLTAEIICSVFHVPPFKISRGEMPPNLKVEDLNQIYYTDCLQRLFEDLELCLSEGMSLPSNYKIQLDLDGLLRMDTKTLYEVLGEGIKGAVLTINEARKKVNLPAKEGGDIPYLQQQNFSIEALSRRDAQADPFTTSSNVNTTSTSESKSIIDNHNKDVKDSDIDEEDQIKLLTLLLDKELASYAN